MVLRLGILGAARIAPGAVIKPVSENSDLAAVVQVCAVAARDGAKAEAFAHEHNIPNVFTSCECRAALTGVPDSTGRGWADLMCTCRVGVDEELLARNDIDAVYIPLPNSLHAQWAVKALAAGKHCLVEKPIANNAAEAIAIQRASEDAGCVAVEAFHVLYHPVAARAAELIKSGSIGKLEHIDVQFMVNFEGYDAGVRSKMHAPTPMYEDVRFDSSLGGGAMMDLGCYCISALRNLADEEPRCTAAVPNCWPEDEEIDLGMSADFVFKCGATAHFDCSFVAGEAAGPVTVRVEGSRGTMTVSNYNGGANNGNEIVIRQTADGGIPETLQESVDGPFPNSRGTMYWQLLNFVAECEKCRAAPAHHKAKPWSYDMKSSPADAVLNMAVIDSVYEKAGMSRRRTTSPAPGMASL